MTTLIIEQNKEPQDVPGVVIPPPGVSEPVIKNTPFFPDVDPKRVREEMRLEQTVSPVRLRRAIKTAIAETNAELGEWRERQLDAGYGGWLRRKVQHLILLQRGRCLAVLSVLRRASPVWLFLTTGYEMRGKVFR